jgi:prolyl-tRNA editing enzyme YbaK/EbsC (Cys-tRNA(Pro) deacylase)
VRVRELALARDVTIEPRRFAAPTRTARDAAREIGCSVAEIVKSIVFLADGAPVVVLLSGADRADEARLAAALAAHTVRRATADEAKSATGYAIGGVPPFGHARACRVVADSRLMGFDTVWAAAGLPDAVFAITPASLLRLSDALVADVAA